MSQHVLDTLAERGFLEQTTDEETLRYLVSVARFSKRNRQFVAANPDFRLPPTALAYDAYSAPDWNFYRVSGEETAKFLSGIGKRYLRDGERIRLLEWGCGPARVIRHVNTGYWTRN